MAIDGAPSARPGDLADALVAPLRAAGREVVRVRAGDFLRPASVRFERGRHDPDAFYAEWLDAAGLTREVLAPLGPGGSGRYLPSLWEAAADRATRAAYRRCGDDAVLVLDGTFLLAHGLDLDLTVHLAQRPATIERLTRAEERWTLPAHARYRAEVDPERAADVVARVDHPDRPALLVGAADRTARQG